MQRKNFVQILLTIGWVCAAVIPAKASEENECLTGVWLTGPTVVGLPPGFQWWPALFCCNDLCCDDRCFSSVSRPRQAAYFGALCATQTILGLGILAPGLYYHYNEGTTVHDVLIGLGTSYLFGAAASLSRAVLCGITSLL